MSFPFVKGHGTRNDFIVLPDPDGSIHGDLDPATVRALCDRRAGIGADGVLRAVRSAGSAEWFMDHRNADGSVSEMCGNGIRVFARYLAGAGLIDAGDLDVDTRSGVKHVAFCADGDISVDMGVASLGEPVKVTVEGRAFDAMAVDVGNPHAVAFVDSLEEAGDLLKPPEFSASDFPNGVNVEFVVASGASDIAMRVFERGVGETESCGTGACAAAFAVARRRDAAAPVSYRVHLPGGVVSVTYDAAGRVHLKGGAVLVAEGTWTG